MAVENEYIKNLNTILEEDPKDLSKFNSSGKARNTKPTSQVQRNFHYGKTGRLNLY